MPKLHPHRSNFITNQHQIKQLQPIQHLQVSMSQFFKGSTMWCDSNNPNIQKACKIFASEEVKQVVCIIVLSLVLIKILDLLKYPAKKIYTFLKKKIINLRRWKRLIPSVPLPCILKLDYDSKLDKWVNQARM